MAKRLRVDAEPGHVRGHVYLGSVGAAYNRKRLDALGVTHVLCVASGLQPAHPGAFVYEQVEVLDAPTEDLAAPSARVTPSAGPYGSALRALPRLHRAGQAERRERARALLCRQVALHQRRAGLAAPGPRDAPAGRPRPGAGAARGRSPIPGSSRSSPPSSASSSKSAAAPRPSAAPTTSSSPGARPRRFAENPRRRDAPATTLFGACRAPIDTRFRALSVPPYPGRLGAPACIAKLRWAVRPPFHESPAEPACA